VLIQAIEDDLKVGVRVARLVIERRKHKAQPEPAEQQPEEAIF
jgi:hypothetical protein